MAFHIITDSASDVPKSVREEFHLHVIPTPVTIDEVDYFDGDTIQPAEFYQIQAEGKSNIKTYHISQQMFYDHFRPYAEAGDEVLYICFSTGIAGTYQAANLAKADLLEEFPDFQITIIDSKCASIGFGLVTYYLLLMQKNGAPKDLMIEAASWFCAHMTVQFTVETLHYLYKGGRVGALSAAAGGILDIKPILIVDEEGALKGSENVRGWKKAIRRVEDMIGEKCQDLDHQLIGVVSGSDPSLADQVGETLMERYHAKGILKSQVGCAIGAHTGGGIVGITALDAMNPEYEKYLY
ncbi:MAG: DegV family protein [Lachnospiraceae bacterium]|nr:DegV family protein [Lachnospiraceae bacterium]